MNIRLDYLGNFKTVTQFNRETFMENKNPSSNELEAFIKLMMSGVEEQTQPQPKTIEELSDELMVKSMIIISQSFGNPPLETLAYILGNSFAKVTINSGTSNMDLLVGSLNCFTLGFQKAVEKIFKDSMDVSRYPPSSFRTQ